MAYLTCNTELKQLWAGKFKGNESVQGHHTFKNVWNPAVRKDWTSAVILRISMQLQCCVCVLKSTLYRLICPLYVILGMYRRKPQGCNTVWVYFSSTSTSSNSISVSMHVHTLYLSTSWVACIAHTLDNRLLGIRGRIMPCRACDDSLLGKHVTVGSTSNVWRKIQQVLSLPTMMLGCLQLIDIVTVSVSRIIKKWLSC